MKGRDGRRRKREQAREEVMRGALRLAESSPFHDVTVDEIARAAGLSRSAFYTHFSDKHDLLLAALAEIADEIRREADGWWKGEGPPAERVRGAITGLVSVHAENASVLRVATEVSTYDDEIRAAWWGLVEGFIAATADHIRSEQRAGLIGNLLEARPTAEGLVWMVERCCHLYLFEGDRTPEGLVDGLAPVWIAALYPGLIPADELRPGTAPISD